MRALRLMLLAVPLALPASSCGGGDSASAAANPDAWTLFRGLTAASTVELICPEAELLAAARHSIERTQSRSDQRLVIVEPDRSDPELPRMVIGTLADPYVSALAVRAGVAMSDGSALIVGGAQMRRPEDVLVATVADPERAGLPLTLFLGNSPRGVSNELDVLVPHWRIGVLALRGGLPFRAVPLHPDGSPDWSGVVDFTAVRRDRDGAEYVEPPPRVIDGRVVLRLAEGVDAARAQAYGDLAAAASRAVQTAFGAGGPRVNLRVVASVEDAIARDAMRDLSRVLRTDPPGAVALLAPDMPHDGGACAARATALASLGPTHVDWMLDGVGTAYADNWWGRPREAWSAYLVTAGLARTAAELVAPDADARISPHVLGPLRGELFELLVASRGAEAVAELWRGGTRLACDDALEREFAAHLTAVGERHASALDRARIARRDAAASKRWRGGVHVAPAGGDLDLVFGSSALKESLAGAARAGAGCAAFTPFVFLEPRAPRFAGMPPRPLPDGSPGDLALAHALRTARAAGLHTMLAPELQLTSTGTWFDAGALGGRDQVEEAFARATQALEHYGLLAELCGVDVLCLSSERIVMSATRSDSGDVVDPRAAMLRAGWKALIARVRAAFAGGLTYAAGPSYELERIEFWDDLDLIGINLFRDVANPVGGSSTAAAARKLESLVSRAASFAALHGRPLLIVQSGYPSNAEAAAQPLLASGAPDVAQQAALFEVLADVIAKAREDGELAGFFLWRWDPDPAAGGVSDPTHTPQHKPAAAVLPRLLGR